MALAKSFDKWEEWQKVAYPFHKKSDLAKMFLVAEFRFGRNYLCLIDRREPYLENHGMQRLYLNGYCFLFGFSREIGLKKFEYFCTGLKDGTLKLPYDCPVYKD